MTATRQILATKLHAPLLTGPLVARPRLFDRLHDALRRPLTAVIAPPGFGKTTLVSSWAASVHTRGLASVAWLTLDPYDDDPAGFWTAVIAALQTIDPALGLEVLPFLSTITPLCALRRASASPGATLSIGVCAYEPVATPARD